MTGAGFKGPLGRVQKTLHTNTQTDRQHTEKVYTKAPLIAGTLRGPTYRHTDKVITEDPLILVPRITRRELQYKHTKT